jgi:hypothetical protein
MKNSKLRIERESNQAILLSASTPKHSKAPAAQSTEQTRNGMVHP